MYFRFEKVFFEILLKNIDSCMMYGKNGSRRLGYF